MRSRSSDVALVELVSVGRIMGVGAHIMSLCLRGGCAWIGGHPAKLADGEPVIGRRGGDRCAGRFLCSAANFACWLASGAEPLSPEIRYLGRTNPISLMKNTTRLL